MRKSLVILLLGLAVAACGTDSGDEHAGHTSTPPVTSGGSETPVPQGGAVTVTNADNGQERKLNTGQRLVVRLPSNPSTGYGWQVTGLDQNVVKQAGDREYVSDQPVMPGTPGTEVWTFTGDAAGSTQLKMEYKRPWEQGVEPAETFTVVLVVV
ncbi:protease inhibitor I42 family protein [Nocardia goodfellowii]|uniref:Inhibitor of cysteine peptidase n=1 Tax=Nocardia goodfellowii TaxID=882446 RepID=A0ABS4QDT5_9NOCA|nr:protease inhibitor I42 family protein [Nocardia goodfellowii]MBP2189844.1 inhibitor of cysteine peptidase [Nocardia goodfellowii]